MRVRRLRHNSRHYHTPCILQPSHLLIASARILQSSLSFTARNGPEVPPVPTTNNMYTAG